MLGDVIRTARESLYMTQGDLAIAAKTTQPTISRIEAGIQRPNSTLLYNIAHALMIEPASLLEAVAVTEQYQQKRL